MADRYSGQENHGRNTGRHSRGRWRDMDMGERGRGGMSRERSEDFDEDDYRFSRDDDDRQGFGARDRDDGQRDQMRYGQGGQGYEQGGSSYGQGGAGRGNYGQGNYGQEQFGQGGRSGQGQYRQSGQSQNFGQYGAQHDQGRQSQSDEWGQHHGQGGGQGVGAQGGQNYGRGSQMPSGQGGQWGSGQGQYGQAVGQQGRHRGRGPKNYTRSDDRIRDDINDRLTDDHDIDAGEIEVKVTSCEVVLSGTVDSREAKRRAEDIVEAVSGVKHVQNNLRVQSSDEDSVRANAKQAKGGADNKSDKMQ
ncbi:MAG: BON domain-containing protein [Phycisphaerales bacterium]|nr:BON domain-containing protein [Hyphomonadaceae bacterium]